MVYPWRVIRPIVLLSSALLCFTGCHALAPLIPGPDQGRTDAPATTDGPRRPDLGGADGPILPEGGATEVGVALDGAPVDLPGTDGSGTLQIISIPVTKVGSMLQYKYDAEVNTTAPVTWSLTEKPSGMTVDPATGLVTWAPLLPIGFHPVVLKVSDGTQETSQSYEVEVIKGGAMNGLRPGELAALVRAGAVRRLAAGPLQGAALQGRVGPRVRRALAYLVSCALPAGERLQISTAGGVLAVEGALGLAPGWRDAPCDAACQEWVSACLAARVNTRGEPVAIAFAGRHPALAAPEDVAGAEGAFFGNLFAEEPWLFACRKQGAPRPARGRRCTLAGGECAPVVSVGGCEQACQPGPAGRTSCRVGRRVFSRPIEVLGR